MNDVSYPVVEMKALIQLDCVIFLANPRLLWVCSLYPEEPLMILKQNRLSMGRGRFEGQIQEKAMRPFRRRSLTFFILETVCEETWVSR